MSRTTTRAAALTGLTATTAAAGLLLAPAALAESLPVVSHSEVTAGQAFTVSGKDCQATKDDEPAIVYVSAISQDESGVLGIMDVPGSGDWEMELEFPSEAQAGDYELLAACEGYEGAETFVYYPVPITLKAAATPSTPTPTTETATPTTAPQTKPTGAIRGAQANTPGVTSPDTGKATGDSAVPGRKVVKVLTGFKPGEVVTVTLHSTPQTMGTFTADQNGTVTVEFTIPAGTPTGDHTLVYEGDMGTYFQESFTVAAAAATSNASSGSLAYTGADIALPLGLGVGALALGGGLVFAARRRSAEGSQA